MVAVDDVLALATVGGVVVHAAEDAIVALVPVHQVVALVAVDQVVAGETAVAIVAGQQAIVSLPAVPVRLSLPGVGPVGAGGIAARLTVASPLASVPSTYWSPDGAALTVNVSLPPVPLTVTMVSPLLVPVDRVAPASVMACRSTVSPAAKSSSVLLRAPVASSCSVCAPVPKVMSPVPAEVCRAELQCAGGQRLYHLSRYWQRIGRAFRRRSW